MTKSFSFQSPAERICCAAHDRDDSRGGFLRARPGPVDRSDLDIAEVLRAAEADLDPIAALADHIGDQDEREEFRAHITKASTLYRQIARAARELGSRSGSDRRLTAGAHDVCNWPIPKKHSKQAMSEFSGESDLMAARRDGRAWPEPDITRMPTAIIWDGKTIIVRAILPMLPLGTVR